MYWKCGEHRHSMTGESTSPSTICPRTCSFSVCTKRDLPRPASPMSNTTWPIHSFASTQPSKRRLTSVSRPVNGATRAISDTSSTAPLGSGTGPEGDDFENFEALMDPFPSSGIPSRAFLNCGEPPILIDHRHTSSARHFLPVRLQSPIPSEQAFLAWLFRLNSRIILETIAWSTLGNKCQNYCF